MGSPQSRHSGQEGAEVQGARAALTETPTKRGHVRTPRACASAIVRTRARGHPEVLPTPHPSGCLMRFCVVPDIRPCPTRPGASQHPLTTHLASRANAWPMRHSRGWCQRGLHGVLRKARRPIAWSASPRPTATRESQRSPQHAAPLPAYINGASERVTRLRAGALQRKCWKRRDVARDVARHAEVRL